MLSLPGQMGHGRPADPSHVPAQLSWLVLAVAEELLSSGESSMPTATSCKESGEKGLPFPPERTRRVAKPQKLCEGTARGLPKALLEGCKGRRATGGQMGWI